MLLDASGNPAALTASGLGEQPDTDRQTRQEVIEADDRDVQIEILKQKRLQLMEAKLRAAKDDPLELYRPHEKQDRFHRAGEFKHRMTRAGNRFGKSMSGAAEDCAWMRGERVWYRKDDPARMLGIPRPPNVGLVIATEWEIVERLYTGRKGGLGLFFKLLKPKEIEGHKVNSAGVISMIALKNGSMVAFDTVKSFSNNPQGSESLPWDFMHIDEPCPQDMYNAQARGLMDRGGKDWFMLTPLKEPWINDMFFPEDIAQLEYQEITDGRKMYWSITGSAYDNIFLSPQDIADFERTLTDDEKQCRIRGIPLHLSGLVYKEFDRGLHVLKELPGTCNPTNPNEKWENFNSPPLGWPIYYAIDPHPQTPHAVLLLTVTPMEQIIVFDEIFHHTTVAELSVMVRTRTEGRHVVMGRIDPLAYINDPISGSNMAEEFIRYGVFVEKATKARESGILKVKAVLKTPGKFYVVPNLKRTIFEFGRYCWDEKENKPKDKDDHMMENLYRLLLDEPVWVDPPKAEENRAVDHYDIPWTDLGW